MTSQSVNILRGGSGEIELKFTVPFPCRYKKDAVHIDKIDHDSCPLQIELAIPKGSSGVCGSRLTGQSGCGLKISPSELNNTFIMNIRHQDNNNYELTLAEAEYQLYLKTYEFGISQAWTDVLLPVVNVIITCSFQFSLEH